MASLATLRAGEPSQLKHLDALAGLVDEKLQELHATIEQRRSGTLDKAIEGVREGSGKRLMDQARTIIADMKLHAQQLAVNAQDWLEQASNWLLADTILAFVLLMLTGALTMMRLRQQTLSVERGREELRRAHDQLVVEVRQREYLEAQMQQARLRLEKLQVAAAQAERQNIMSGMISALAHDINQPMTAARALARAAHEGILRSPKDLDQLRASLESMVSCIDSAAEVVRGMRDLLQRDQSEFAVVEVKSVLEDASSLARNEMQERPLEVVLDLTANLPQLYGDRIQVQQVVLNLVRNSAEAIFRSGQLRGRVTISARASADASAVEIAVRDNGPGIQSGRSPFSPSSSSKADGLGLGLSICEKIVSTHGGRIWLQSGEAGATEFRFVLPAYCRRAISA
jgi:C4-dicarboxylate-specific signal transduction histidine kinase